MDCYKSRCLSWYYYVSNYNKILIKYLLTIFSHFINENFELISFLLGIKDLKDKHLGSYMCKVLLKALQEYNIKYNITR